jgi:HEAT repeat protein
MRYTHSPLAVFVLLLAALAVWAQVNPRDLKDPKDPKEPKVNKENPNPVRELSRGSTFGGKNLDQWIQDLKSKDPSVKENAIATLKLYGTVAREATPILATKCLVDNDVSVRVNAAISLGFIGADDKDLETTVAALCKALNDSESIVRYQSAMALGRFGTDAKAAIPHLIPLLKADPYSKRHSWELRKAAAFALGGAAMNRQEGPDPRATNALVEVLGDVSHQVRLEAVLSLIVLGRPDKQVDRARIEAGLTRLFKDPNKHVQIWSRLGVMRFQDVNEKHLVEIGKMLKEPEATVRSHAARALGTVGPQAKSRVHELVDALQAEQDPPTVYWIVWAMVQIGDAAPRALAALKQLTQSKDPDLKMIGEEAIKMLVKGKEGAPPPNKK